MKNKCLECEKTLIGRSDKKFCDVYCKNNWHNRQNQDKQAFIRRLNAKINANYKILHRLKEKEQHTVHRNILEKEGYDFSRSSEIAVLHENDVVYFCFELGIKPLENGYFALTIKEE